VPPPDSGVPRGFAPACSRNVTSGPSKDPVRGASPMTDLERHRKNRRGWSVSSRPSSSVSSMAPAGGAIPCSFLGFSAGGQPPVGVFASLADPPLGHRRLEEGLRGRSPASSPAHLPKGRRPHARGDNTTSRCAKDSPAIPEAASRDSETPKIGHNDPHQQDIPPACDTLPPRSPQRNPQRSRTLTLPPVGVRDLPFQGSAAMPRRSSSSAGPLHPSDLHRLLRLAERSQGAALPDALPARSPGGSERSCAVRLVPPLHRLGGAGLGASSTTFRPHRKE